MHVSALLHWMKFKLDAVESNIIVFIFQVIYIR